MRGFLMLFLLWGVTVARAESPTVVELFTSQGCYSCPPADRLLGKLESPDTITIACHVTYWNYLGWRDTFSKSFCDQRQRGYQSQLQGYAGVYTPQMVIDGRYGVVGSQAKKVQQLMVLSQQQPLQKAALSLDSDNRLQITLPKSAQRIQQVWLLGIADARQVPIARGENGGKQLTYHHPLIEVIDLGRWDGQPKTIEQPVKANRDIAHWVVIAQAQPLGAITSVGKISTTQ